MEALSAKLTNLSYEIFGILAPGLIGSLFLLSFWWSLGTIPSSVTRGGIPDLHYWEIRSFSYNLFDLLSVLAVSYFIGHLLFWLASRRHCDEVSGHWRRILACLTLRIPKPSEKYSPHLHPMVDAILAHLGMPQDKKSWDQLYPVAKVMLSEQLSRSLVSTYQNKYTLHRSTAAAAALLFWVVAVATIVLVLRYLLAFTVGVVPVGEPRWTGLLFNAVASIAIVWVFSDSFAYNWKMFGNTVVTETFALVSKRVGRGRSDD